MFSDNYKNLNSAEKEEFRRMANYLLSHNYLVRYEYKPQDKMTLPNKDYQFVSRFLELFKEYFEYSGWKLERDDNFGVIAIANQYDHNRFQLNRFTTLFLYVCRIIYEEGMADMGSFKTVETSTKTVIDRMGTYGLLEKKKDGSFIKTSQKERIEAQRILAHFNIIRKLDSGPWDGDGNRIIILPAILSIITNQGINAMYAEIEGYKTGEAGEESGDSGGEDGDENT
jgi:hypothetical protein